MSTFLQLIKLPPLIKLTRTMSTAIPQRLQGKVAAVTASTDGIGYAIAKRLGQEGAKVVISSRKQKNVDSAVEKLKSEGLCVTGLVCHVSKSEDRKRLFDETEKLGGLDILVSNAAANPSMEPILDCEESAWDKIFEVNVKASWLLAKEALSQLRKKQSGRIIFISSIGGFDPFNLLGAYSVSKTTLLGLTKAIAQQLAEENITVNCVAPGIIQTKFSAALTEDEAARDVTLSKIPMRRIGKPDEIGSVVAFIASDDASYLTGENIVVAGGMTSRL